MEPIFCLMRVFGSPASHTDFQHQRCEGGRFYVNGGWDLKGFITVPVVDEARGLMAYPAYNYNDFTNKNPLVYPNRSYYVERVPGT